MALLTAQTSTSKGFQNIFVDGDVNPLFKQRLEATGVNVVVETAHGMSPSRQQALRAVAALPGVEVIVWREPEKVSTDRDCLPLLTLPIFSDEADITIPQRNKAGFATYPTQQAEYEQRANKAFTANLVRFGYYPKDAPILDAWHGPRAFRNNPDILNHFLRTYRYQRPSDVVEDTNQNERLSKLIRPELWPNALFMPLITALKDGLRVVPVEVPYLHPQIQTDYEQSVETADFAKREKFNFRISLLHKPDFY